MKRKAGFTLIELIVSLAITSVIAVFVFGFATSLAKLWRTTEGGVSTELDAQITLDRIAQDLEAALFQERVDGDGNPVPMFAISAVSQTMYEAENLSTGLLPAALDVYARPAALHFAPSTHHYGWAGSWIRFFTSTPSFNAVAYRIVRRPAFASSKDNPLYLLHRSVIRHDNTLAGGFDIVSGQYAAGSTTDALRRPQLTGAILEDVVDFGVRLFIYDSVGPTVDSPAGLRLIFPADAGGLLDSTDLEHLGLAHEGTVYGQRYPDLIEVFLRVLDDVGSDLLFELEKGDPKLTYQEIVDQHSRVYRRMVRMPGREPVAVLQ